jgi:hypothetical protein
MVPGDPKFDNVVTFWNHHKSKVDYKEPSDKFKLGKMLKFIEEWPEEMAIFRR